MAGGAGRGHVWSRALREQKEKPEKKMSALPPEVLQHLFGFFFRSGL